MEHRNPFWLFGGTNSNTGAEPQGGMRDYLGSYATLTEAVAGACRLRYNPNLRCKEELHWWHIYNVETNQVVRDKTYGDLPLTEEVVMSSVLQEFVVDTNTIVRPVQYVRHKGLNTAVIEYGELLCDACDQVVANEGTTVRVGDTCWCCHTPIVGCKT